MNNSRLVIFKLRTVQRSSFDHVPPSGTLTFRKNKDVLHPFMAKKGKKLKWKHNQPLQNIQLDSTIKLASNMTS
jgi:hypothetical protein